MLKFLFELKDIPFEKRIKFINQLVEKKETNKAGEKLMIILNRLNDIEKAKIIGRLFNHTILEEIEFEDFNRLTHIIDNAYINDIKLLKNNAHLGYIDNDVKSNLSQLGLVTLSVSDILKQQEFLDRSHSSSKAQPKLEYKANKYCKILVKFGFD